MLITNTYEEELLGTAGTLEKNLNFFSNSLGLVLYADNMTDDNLQNLVKTHQKERKLYSFHANFQTKNLVHVE